MMSIVRSQVIALMRKAFREGQSARSFIWDMRQKGLGYRHTTMRADWRAVNELETKAGLMKYVRKDYYPAKTVMAELPWKLSQEYMYVVRVKSRIEPGIPITERKVNIMSDVPMTPAMIEQAIVEKWSEWEDYTAEELGEMIMFTAVHRTME